MNVGDLSLPASLPWGGRVVVLAIGAVLVALTGCGSDGQDAVRTTMTAEDPPASSSAPPASLTPGSAATTATGAPTPTSTTEGAAGGVVVGERAAFLVDLVNEPASATDGELADQFAPSFLAAVPPDDIRAAAAEAAAAGSPPWSERDRDLSASGGSITLVSADGVELTVVFELDSTSERRIVAAQLVPGSVAVLEDALTAPGTIGEIDAAFDAIASRVVYSVFDAGDDACAPLLARNAETAAPMGSTFKLWVLATLARAVDAGDAAWDETVDVTDALRSSPDGEVYPLPTGTPVTLRHLAGLMISISDNTATDMLVARLGRPAIEATMAEVGVSTVDRNIPLLTTADLFRLKYVDPTLGERYVAITDPEQRRALLDGDVAATPLPWVADPTWTGDPSLLSVPHRIDEIEWFATPHDVCLTFHDLDRLASQPGLEPVATILEQNPGLPFPAGQWSTVRFKGGSEPGVAMFAYWLVAPTGERRVVVVGLSDPAVAFSELDAALPAARLLGLVAQGG